MLDNCIDCQNTSSALCLSFECSPLSSPSSLLSQELYNLIFTHEISRHSSPSYLSRPLPHSSPLLKIGRPSTTAFRHPFRQCRHPTFKKFLLSPPLPSFLAPPHRPPFFSPSFLYSLLALYLFAFLLSLFDAAAAAVRVVSSTRPR